ncbi:hypothetical protein [Streptomyces acidicola]|uniref:Uncharacterized protein n=1 Tax=Streptomyces acidicola TaxID=2596892 RepID=A0A5N8WZX4_9ACTN|nr:hypothetical protein [Streptomyces acidicola]MPY52128.1 hypothetical protein [Streptomyces acidicola]
MTDLIGRVIVWVSLLLTGHEPHAKPPSRPTPATLPLARVTPLPAHRSPYGLDDSEPLDGAATRAVRPYVIAHEQRQRRRELAMAALGLDMPGPYWVHGLEVA